jgi:ABC-2 type transport system permease protein
VLVIPADFSESVRQRDAAQSVLELYANPSRPNSTGVVRSIVDGFLSRVAAGTAAGQVTVLQLVQSGVLSPAEAASAGPAIGERAGRAAASLELMAVKSEMAGERSGGFDWLTYMAPSMAIMFLMFAATAGGRSMLAERDAGTLPRMLATPTSSAQVIGGKMLGTYLTGLSQMAVLILAGGLIFDVHWGEPLAVVLLVLALVAAATAWGMVIGAYARTPGQANAVGIMLALIFGALAGNFVPRQLLPQVLQTASYISPNAWGLESFSRLTGGGSLADVAPAIAALLAMAAVLFAVAVAAFRRQVR